MQGSNTSEVEGEEEDITWLTLRKPNVDTHARLQPSIDLTSLPGHLNLFEASSRYNLAIAGGANGFNVYLLSDLETLLGSSPKSTTVAASPFKSVTVGQRLIWLKLAKEETVLVVGTASSQILLYSLQDIRSQSASSPQPTQTFPSLPSPINSLLPNPSAFPSLLLILLPEFLSLVDIDTQQESTRLEGAYTAACWSAKGKQFVLGDAQARLRFFSPDGQEKGTPIERPAGLAEGEGYYVHSVNWLENDVFLVVYNLPSANPAEEPEHSYETFIIQRIKFPSPEVKYTRFSDPTPAYGMIDRPGMRYSAFLSGWGGKGNWLGFLGTSPSPQLGVIQGTSTGEWKILNLDEATRPGVPMTENTAEDTAILGMALDLRSDKKIKRGMEGGEELKDLEPAPKLMVFTSDGVLASWDLWNVDQQMGSYEGMLNSSATTAAAKAIGKVTGEVSMAGTPTASPPSTSTATAGAASAFAGFGLGSSSTPSAFGSSAFSGSSPAPVKSVSSGSAFGSSAFGSSSSPSPFGAPSTLSTSAFGQASAFGSGAQPPVPAFGSNPSSASNPPSIFGSNGATSSTGSSTQTNDLKPTGFGAFGGTTPSPFGSSTTPSAFGASTTPFAFGSTTASAPPVSSAFGQQSAFGKPSTFGSSSAASPSSTSNTAPPSSAFGAFGGSSGRASGFGFGAAASPSLTTTATSESSTSFTFGSAGRTSGQTSTFGAGTPSSFGNAVKPNEDDKKEAAADDKKPASPFSGGFSAFSNINTTSSTTPTPSATATSTAAPASPSPVVSAFGQPSKPAFGVSTFGAPPSFGSSTFGTPPTSKASTSAFGSPTLPSTSSSSPSSGSAFASFSGPKAGVGFVGFGSSANKPSVFASTNTAPPTSATSSSTTSVFGKPQTSAFGTPITSEPTESKFGKTSAMPSAFGSSSSTTTSGFAGFGSKNPASSGSSPVASAFGGAFARAGTGSGAGSSFGRGKYEAEEDDDDDGGARLDEISDEDGSEEVVNVKKAPRAGKSDNLFGSTAFSFGGLGGQNSGREKDRTSEMFGGLTVKKDDKEDILEDNGDGAEDGEEDEEEEEYDGGEEEEEEDEEDEDGDEDEDEAEDQDTGEEEEEDETEHRAQEEEEGQDIVRVEIEDGDQATESVVKVFKPESLEPVSNITPIDPEPVTSSASPPAPEAHQVTATVVKIEEVAEDREEGKTGADVGAKESLSASETSASSPIEGKASSTVTFEPSEKPDVEIKETEQVPSMFPLPAQENTSSFEQKSQSASGAPVAVSTPSTSSFEKPSPFGSKSIFTSGKGFQTSAPIKSSPLASPPISLDSSTTTPPDSPTRPASMIPVPVKPKVEQGSSASPFSFGTKPVASAPSKPSSPLGFSSSEPNTTTAKAELEKVAEATKDPSSSESAKPVASPFAGFGQSQLPVPTKDTTKQFGSALKFGGSGPASEPAGTKKFAGFGSNPVSSAETTTTTTTTPAPSGGVSFGTKPAGEVAQSKASDLGSTKPANSQSSFSFAGFGASNPETSAGGSAAFGPSKPLSDSTSPANVFASFGAPRSSATTTPPSEPAFNGFGSFKSTTPTSEPALAPLTSTNMFAGSGAKSSSMTTTASNAFAESGVPKSNSAASSKPGALVPFTGSELIKAPAAPATSTSSNAFAGFETSKPSSTSESPFGSGSTLSFRGIEAPKPSSVSLLTASETSKTLSPNAFNNGSTTPKTDIVKPAFPQRSSAPTPRVSDTNLSRETGLAGEFIRAYQSMEADFAKMKATSEAYATFQREAGTPTPVAGDLQSQTTWTLGDIRSFSKLIKEKEKDTSSLKDESEEMKRTIGELQSYLLKADTKLEEVARFLRARDDPDFAKMVRIRQLGPEHLENQQRLRKTTQTVRDRIGQLENHLDILRKEVIREKNGRASMKAPTLDSISRTIRNITAAVREKAFEIEDLSLRLHVLQLSGSNKNSSFKGLNASERSRRESTPLNENISLTSSPLRSTVAQPTPKVGAMAARALNSESKALQLKKRLVTINKGPIITSVPDRTGGPIASVGNSSVIPDGFVVRSPVKFEALPSPRRAAPTTQTSLVGTMSHEVPSEALPKETPSASPSISSFSPDTTFQSSSSFLETPSKPPRPAFGLSSTPVGTPPVTTAGPIGGLGLTSSFSALPSGQDIGTFASTDFQPLQPGREYEPRRRTGRMSTHQSAPKLGAHAGSAKLASPSGFSFGPPPVLLDTAGSFSNTFEGLQPPKPVTSAASGRFGFTNLSKTQSLTKPQTVDHDDREEEDETDQEEGEEEEQEEEEQEEEEEDDEDYWAREGKEDDEEESG
ncbi:Nuclear pore complex, Nup214/CAN component [Phaffia rhodozyma]|uniref:Nuclear pore complex, Nup214/CAN component n=1 Tax=Phaffia rhodozyma TaxID=264483 RepID=A0A0F7SVL6_PHARH|nr:Nuclear pore complex, Nup214/CAN component [Phaffia rhodozyma]